MKKLLITGAAGQLGKALAKEISFREDFRLYLSAKSSPETEDEEMIFLDVANWENCQAVLMKINPDIIINCAAFTAVDVAEANREEAYAVNVLGVENLAKLAREISAKLVHISTDYIFDGEKDEPYAEDDIPNPLNYYAQTKAESEKIVLEYSPGNIIFRTAWMYGEGKNFVNTILKLTQTKREIKVVSDQWGNLTSAEAAAKAIVFLINRNAQGIFHGCCKGVANWYEIAKKVLELAEMNDVKVIPITSEEYNAPAKRPRYSAMANKHLEEMGYVMPQWDEELERWLKKK
ncbi:dTDP-4-dehydrorhamnose reductase [Clostridiales bacterium COT073_COT-073]|nr:dTDP-4-dehydrorhamnose reductase [Clostridiales bacterium COT073_COT-073]